MNNKKNKEQKIKKTKRIKRKLNNKKVTKKRGGADFTKDEINEGMNNLNSFKNDSMNNMNSLASMDNMDNMDSMNTDINKKKDGKEGKEGNKKDTLLEEFLDVDPRNRKLFNDEELLFEPNYFDKLNLSSQIRSYFNQGYYPVGINLNAVIQNNSKDKAKDDSVFEINKEKKTINTIGEYVDEDYGTVIKTLSSKRDPLNYKNLQPQNVLNSQSTFREIINESKKYTTDENEMKVTPNGLYKMCKMLYKFRKNDEVWYKVASLLLIMFRYLGSDLQKESFFAINFNIKDNILQEIEELWKTEHIFMTEFEKINMEKKLEYFK